MDLEIKIDENLKEPKITISSPTLTDEIKNVTEILKNSLVFNNKLNVSKDSNMYILKLEEIETIYASNNKVYVRSTNNELYTTKEKLYQLEEKLKFTSFVRISNYVSRRFIKSVKDYLKI